MLLLIFIFLTAFVATLISSMSGGGSSIIAIPVYLMLGIPFPAARIIQMVNGAFWTPVAAWNFLRGRRLEIGFVTIFTILGFLGMYAGIMAIVLVPDRTLKILVGCLIFMAVLLVYFRGSLGIEKRERQSRFKRLMGYPFSIILGFYEVILGSGNGIFLSIVTCETRGYDMIDALGAYFVIGFFWDVFGLIFLYQWGHVDPILLIPAVTGAILGSFIGSRFARAKGNAFIKNIFVGIGIILAFKMIFFS